MSVRRGPLAPGREWRTEVAEGWDETGLAWERWEPFLMHALQGVNIPLLRALRAEPGHRVLDVGCGLGEPTLSVASWVAPAGKVVGLDVARSMVRAARRRAAAQGVRNVTFREGDVTRMRPAADFDRVTSRFGLMFADDVPAMLETLLGALRPGGRAAFAVWASARVNPFFRITSEAVAPYIEEMPDPETSPHPMRFARRGLLARRMEEAGFRRLETTLAHVSFVYPSPEIFADIHLDTSGTLRKLLGGLSVKARRQVRAALVDGAAAHLSGPVVRIPGTAWIVAGDRPAKRAR